MTVPTAGRSSSTSRFDTTKRGEPSRCCLDVSQKRLSVHQSLLISSEAPSTLLWLQRRGRMEDAPNRVNHER